MGIPSRQRVHRMLLHPLPTGPWSGPVILITTMAAVGGALPVVPGHSDKIVVFQPCLRNHTVTAFCRGRNRCTTAVSAVVASSGIWEQVLPSPLFSTPPLLSGPRFFLQFEENEEEVAILQGTGCGNGLDPPQAVLSNGSAGLSPTRAQSPPSTNADDSTIASNPVAGHLARPGGQAQRMPGPKAHNPGGGRTFLPEAKPHQCELCDLAPACYRWVVKGGWLRKARNRAKSSTKEAHQTINLQLAASWRQGTSHHLCSECKLWAFEISSAEVKGAQNNVTSSGPWAQLRTFSSWNHIRPCSRNRLSSLRGLKSMNMHLLRALWSTGWPIELPRVWKRS